MMSEALLRLGHDRARRPTSSTGTRRIQFASGKVPCCVDARGADPVPEHDSARRVHPPRRAAPSLCARRGAQPDGMWPHVRAAADHIESLRQRDDGRREPGARPRAFSTGCCPRRSATKAIRPSRCTVLLGRLLGARAAMRDARVARRASSAMQAEAATLTATRATSSQRDILASIAAAREHAPHRLHPRRGRSGRLRRDLDHDRASIAGGEQAQLAAGAAASHLRALLARIRRRARDGRKDVGRLHALRIAHRRRVRPARLARRAPTRLPSSSWPTGGRRRGTSGPKWSAANAREPRFVGDMPHGWVASDFITRLLDMFAYERDARWRAGARRRAVADGVAGRRGHSRRRLRTPYGQLDYTLAPRRRPRSAHLRSATAAAPPGGLVLAGRRGMPASGVWRRQSRPRSICRHRRQAIHAKWSTDSNDRDLSNFPTASCGARATSAYQIEGSPLADGAGAEHLAALRPHARPDAQRRHRRRRLRPLQPLPRRRRADAVAGACRPTASASLGAACCREGTGRGQRGRARLLRAAGRRPARGGHRAAG